MRWFDVLRLRLRTLFARGRVEDELTEELRYHLQRQEAEEVAKGSSPDEARRKARLRHLRGTA